MSTGLAGNASRCRSGRASTGVEFDIQDTARGSAWRSRTEHYLTDPSKEPDPAKWDVDVAYLTSQA